MWVRRLRSLLFVGLLGSLSAMLSAIWLKLESVLFEPANSFLWFGSLLFSPGLWFGLVVLLPLSRWRGRNWIWSLLAVPASAGCEFGAIMGFGLINEFMRTALPQDEMARLVNDVVAFCGLGICGGLFVQLWMTDWSRSGRVRRMLPVMLAGLISTGLTALMGGLDSRIPWGLPEPLIDILMMQRLLGPFQTIVAIALGDELCRSYGSATTAALRPADSDIEASCDVESAADT